MHKSMIILTLSLSLAYGMTHPAASSVEHHREKLTERYLGTLYPAIPALEIPKAIANAIDPDELRRHSSVERRKRDFFIPAVAAGLGYGAGRLLSFYAQSSQPEVVAGLSALAAVAVTASLKPLYTPKPLQADMPAQEEVISILAPEPIDSTFIEDERAFLKEQILPLLNSMLTDDVSDIDRQYARYKFEQQWLETATKYEAWEEAHNAELTHFTTDPHHAVTVTLENSNETDEWVNMIESEKSLADFYPEELKREIEQSGSTGSSPTEDEDWIEIRYKDVGPGNLATILQHYAEQAACNRKRLAACNAKAAMERVQQLNRYSAASDVAASSCLYEKS